MLQCECSPSVRDSYNKFKSSIALRSASSPLLTSDLFSKRKRLFIQQNLNKSKTKSTNLSTTMTSTMQRVIFSLEPVPIMAKPLMVQVEFEVFGDVSGVFFTKYAREMCEKLKLRGWVMLSRRGTVIGQIQGDKERVDEMALWLRLQGSPGAKIEHCQFNNWQIIDSFDYRNFSIRF